MVRRSMKITWKKAYDEEFKHFERTSEKYAKNDS